MRRNDMAGVDEPFGEDGEGIVVAYSSAGDEDNPIEKLLYSVTGLVYGENDRLSVDGSHCLEQSHDLQSR